MGTSVEESPDGHTTFPIFFYKEKKRKCQHKLKSPIGMKNKEINLKG